ncbi:unnamed protein product [Rotaria sp. Silwood1]|nr:unnamed protein product [Rotaria sp. Silwood1]CAF5034073.1 unnamed protein product [Rotaria sp. Silwood1]CAF5107039.1 unnamed protein product [Rotaria sp. Silwood1]
MNWYRQWDGTVQSLNTRSKGGRPRTMTKNEVKQYILGFVTKMNKQFKPVNYRIVQANVESLVNKKVPLSTIQRYGKEECGLRWRKTHELTSRDVDNQHWNNIAKFRRFLQRIGNDRLVFIDEIAIYAIMLPCHTLVAPGQEPLVIVEKPSAYAERYDFIGAINGSQAISCMILTPTDRKARNIDGVRKEIVNEWIINELAPAINRLSVNNIYLICDKSRAHNRQCMIEALKAGKCKSVLDVCYMPTASAKYISPLDNPIWHKYREVIRSQYPITTTNLPSILSQRFFSLTKEEIGNAYRKCAITRGANVFYDQPSM